MKLSYVPQVIHACCLGYKGFYALIDLSMDDGWIFHQSVFFHPNVRLDSWNALIGMHSTESRVFDREKLKYDVKMVTMRLKGTVSDVDRSLFDGQLSEVTDSDLEELSDGGSVLPPLTESGSEDERGLNGT